MLQIQKHRQVLVRIYPLLDLLIMVCTFFASALAVAHAETDIHFHEFISMRIKVGISRSLAGSSFSGTSFFPHSALPISASVLVSGRSLRHSKGHDRRDRDRRQPFLLLSNQDGQQPLSFHVLGDLHPPYGVQPFSSSGILCGSSGFTAGICETSSSWGPIRGPSASQKRSKRSRNWGIASSGSWTTIGAEPKVFQKTGFRRVSSLEQFPDFLRQYVVDEVLLCLPMSSFYQRASAIVGQCEEQGIIVRFLSDLFNLRQAKSKTDQFEGEYLITLYTATIDGWQAIVKRTSDIVLSLLLILLLSPLFLIVALLIKATSPGPVSFLQERLGLNKRRFRICKFRTMDPDAEMNQAALEDFNEVDGPAFKIKDDPRITPIGRFLRKTSIDELPQLINVLKGDMSLVGPRPLPVRDYEGFDQDWHRRRFSVRPGITCLWQVGGRSNISFDRWMELDMEYIDNWSLGLDLKILAKTIPAVLRGAGAA